MLWGRVRERILRFVKVLLVAYIKASGRTGWLMEPTLHVHRHHLSTLDRTPFRILLLNSLQKYYYDVGSQGEPSAQAMAFDADCSFLCKNVTLCIKASGGVQSLSWLVVGKRRKRPERKDLTNRIVLSLETLVVSD